MPREISSETKLAILALSRKVASCRKISAELAEMGISVERSTVTNVLNKAKDAENGVEMKPKRIPAQCSRPIWIKAIVKKVAKDINNLNPPSQKQMAMKHKVSASTIRRIIDKDCDAELRRK